MKRLFALFLCIIYLAFSNAGLALAGELYFVKNSNKENLKQSIVNTLQDKDFIIRQQDPYYAVSSKDNSNYALIILQQSSNNYFYYFQANNNTSANKTILKAIKNMGATYEQSFNTQYLSMFENQAQKIISNTVGNYSFIDPSVLNLQPSTTQQTPNRTVNAYTGSIVQVPKGSSFKTYLETAINTSNAEIGDEVRAVLSQNWVYNGHVVAPQGSLLIGKLSAARHATYGSRNGKVVFSFNTLITPDGKTYSITTDNIDFTVTNEGKFSRAMGSVVAGVITGALVGLLVAACSKDSSTLKTTAISAGAGAAAGAIKVAAEKGVDAEIPVYTELDVSITAPFSVMLTY